MALLLIFTGCEHPHEHAAGHVHPAVHQADAIDLQTDMLADPSASAEQMKAGAVAFLASLSEEERNLAMFTLDDEVQRTNWSNLPASIYERQGIRIGDLTEAQRVLVHELIRASTSSQGYLKISGLIWMDEILHDQSQKRLEEEGGNDFFRRLVESWGWENFWVSIFGEPATDANWGWMISGHHMTANFTVVDGQVAFTPTFLGSEPYEVKQGEFAGWRALSHEVERGFELMQSLSESQRKQAIIGDEIPRDILEGPGRKQSLEKFEGIAASELSAQQIKLLHYLIQEYVNNADHDAAEAQLAKIEHDGMDKLYFSWIGPTHDITQRFYFRVHGPSILIEYIRERGIGSETGAANHVHSIVRDPGNDYGEDWLEMHYKEHHNN